MLVLVFLAVISCMVIADEQCPTKYARFSTTHTYCLPPSGTCNILHTGVDEDAKKEILMVHNELRSKVAMGNEKQAGGLPEASNMMELEWDDELAVIAEKWASQCNFKHDEGNSRAVERFFVGQNLALGITDVCQDEECIEKFKKPDWKGMINAFYDEVKFFKRELVEKYKKGQKVIEHFTQVIWATSWKIGCGYVIYEAGDKMYKFYACNYGPNGNMEGDIIYKAGKPCTGCPDNTCCGDCASQDSTYTGLCQVVDKNLGPLAESTREDTLTLVDCNWKRGEPTCDFQIDGKQDWTIKPSLDGGPYYSIKLNGGEESSLKLTTPIEPTDDSDDSCLLFTFRKSAADAANGDKSEAVAYLDMGNSNDVLKLEKPALAIFASQDFDIDNAETQLVLKISVPENEPEHIFDLREVVAYDGLCPEEENQ